MRDVARRPTVNVGSRSRRSTCQPAVSPVSAGRRYWEPSPSEGSPIMTVRPVAVDAEDQAECWCCGQQQPPAEMIHLGNHPEVALCLRCAFRTQTRPGSRRRHTVIADRPRTRLATGGPRVRHPPPVATQTRDRSRSALARAAHALTRAADRAVPPPAAPLTRAGDPAPRQPLRRASSVAVIRSYDMANKASVRRGGWSCLFSTGR
jgi:hypothetical protein